jgi:hypothetical protein
MANIGKGTINRSLLRKAHVSNPLRNYKEASNIEYEIVKTDKSKKLFYEFMLLLRQFVYQLHHLENQG